MNIRHILTIILLALVILFALQNLAMIEIQFLLWHLSIPRSLMIFIMLAIGFISGWIAAGISKSKHRE